MSETMDTSQQAAPDDRPVPLPEPGDGVSRRDRTKAFAELVVWSGLASLLVLAFLGGYALADLVF